MKKIILIFLINFFFFNLNVFAQNTLSQKDKREIMENLNTLVEGINLGDINKISPILSEKNQELKEEIQESIRGGVDYRLDYNPFDKNIEFLNQNKIKVKANFSAQGSGWSINGLSTYFIFEKENGKWLLIESDFYKKIGSSYVLKTIKKVFAILGPVFLLAFAFWLWMLIDCLKRDFDDKTLWVLLLFFFNFIGAVLYYFLIKRKNIVRKLPEFKA